LASIEKYFKARTGVDTPDLLTSSATVYDYLQTPVVKFDTASSTNIDYLVSGHLFWNYEEGSLDLSMNGEVLQTVGMQAFMPPTKNNSGETINRGDYVMATGVLGDRLTIAKAVNDGSVAPDYFIGAAATDIVDGSEDGLIVYNGLIKGIYTASWTVGTILYPDPVVSGKLTSTKPTPPSMRTPVAIVIRQHENTGRILVRNSIGSTLGQSDSNVLFTDVSDNDVILYNGSSSYWYNSNFSTAILSTGSAVFGNANVYMQDEAPSNPDNGDIWVDTDSDISLVWAKVIFDTEEPESPENGLLWIDSDSNVDTLDLTNYAPLDSPEFIGVPTAPTASVGTNTTQIATTEFVYSMVTGIDGGSPTSTYEFSVDGGGA